MVKFAYYVTNSFILIQGVDESIEKEEENLAEEVKDEDIVPPIPPLPQSHLQRTHTTDKNSAVAKIISQFQEASNVSSNVNGSIIIIIIIVN